MSEEPPPPNQTSEELRKPDLVAIKYDGVSLVDSQIVSGQQSLDVAHENKETKYKNKRNIGTAIKSWRDKSNQTVDFSSCTFS